MHLTLHLAMMNLISHVDAWNPAAWNSEETEKGGGRTNSFFGPD